MRELVRTIVLVAPLLAASFLLSGCNTAKGVGQDINGAGKAITNGAADVQKKL